MRLPPVPRFQAVGFVLSMPFISLAISYVLYGDRLFSDWRVWAVSFPIIYAIGVVSWRAHSIYDYFLRRKFPSVADTRKRILYKLAVNLLIMTPSIMLIVFVFDFFHVLGYTLQRDDIKYVYLIGLCINIIFESLWEVIYIIDEVKIAAQEKEMIEQLQLRQEFDNLKEKVNPHFLFNSFNTLSSLISEDKQQAEKFLDELSKVYRYLLRSNETGMSTVEQETAFIRSYSRLLQTRYGDGFRLDMNIAHACRDKEIPALTLQLLVENAVKHNIIDKNNPVHVEIRSLGDGYLSVENNLNKKTRIPGESTGLGLSNIKEKYKLLNRVDVTIEETKDRFKVTIPLVS